MSIKQPIPSNLGINLFKQAITPFNNDQTIALPSTPIIAIPAPGEGKIIICPAALGYGGFTVQITNWVADYSNVNADATFVIYQGDNGASTTYGSTNKLANFFGWGAGGDDRAYMSPSSAQIATNGDPLNSLIEFEDKPIFLSIDNKGDGPFEDGDVLNTFRSTFIYYIYDIESGLYVTE